MVEARGGVYHSDPTDTMRGTRAYREGPSPRARAQERRLDIAVPSWADIDARIQAFIEMERQRFEQALEAKLEEERELWREVTASALAQLLRDAPPGPQGPPGPAGKLPSVRVWKSGQVAYEDQVFTYNGASFQALRDTGQEPGGTDWVQIARAGRDGIIPQLRGTYDAKESYKKFDIVALNGSSFITRKDDPGECPGSGWQLHASAGPYIRRCPDQRRLDARARVRAPVSVLTPSLLAPILLGLALHGWRYLGDLTKHDRAAAAPIIS
jgi:hypothetical protein